MRSDSDDEAFTWEGDEHHTRAGRETARASGAASDESTPLDVATPAAAPAESAAPAEPAVPDEQAAQEATEPRPMGNAALIAVGVLGGIYLLYVIGWVIGGLRISRVADFLVSTSGQAPPTWAGGNLVAVWLAAAAPVIWFATVYLLTRGSRPWVRWVWLIAGAVVLVPWPLLMLGAQP